MGSTTRTVAILPIVLVALAAVLSLGGCAGQDPQLGAPRDITGSGEMNPGRGLLTGDAGEWVIFQQ
jgi:hypothetical protein